MGGHREVLVIMCETGTNTEVVSGAKHICISNLCHLILPQYTNFLSPFVLQKQKTIDCIAYKQLNFISHSSGSYKVQYQDASTNRF